MTAIYDKWGQRVYFERRFMILYSWAFTFTILPLSGLLLNLISRTLGNYLDFKIYSKDRSDSLLTISYLNNRLNKTYILSFLFSFFFFEKQLISYLKKIKWYLNLVVVYMYMCLWINNGEKIPASKNYSMATCYDAFWKVLKTELS